MSAEQQPTREQLEAVCDAAYDLASHIKRYWSIDGRPLPEPKLDAMADGAGWEHIAEMLRDLKAQRKGNYPGPIIEWQLRQLVAEWQNLRAGRLAFAVDFQACGFLPPARIINQWEIPDGWHGWSDCVPNTLRALVVVAQIIVKPLQLGIPDSFESKSVDLLRNTASALREAIAFLPSPMQSMILQALDGQAASSHELMTMLDCGSKETLYGKNGRGGLSELSNLGLVKNERSRGGYYRPDKPPAQKAY